MTLMAHRGRCPRCGNDPKGNAAFRAALAANGFGPQAVAWQACKLKDGKDWGPPGTNKKVFDQLAAEGYEIRALIVSDFPVLSQDTPKND